MIAALVAALGVVVAKVLSVAALRRVGRQIAGIDQEREKALDALRLTRSQKKVFEANIATLERKKTRLLGKRSRIEAELKDLGAEVERRELLRERARGKLIRGTRATSQTGDEESPEPGGDEPGEAVDGEQVGE